MKKLLLLFIIISHFCLHSCNESDESIEIIEPSEAIIIETDISITTSESLLTWIEEDDLTKKIENALSYDFGEASEIEIETQHNFNADTTELIAMIDFESTFQEFYTDSDLSNNSIKISLEKNEGIVLRADGPGNTYELITSVLAPGEDPIEAPDCGHSDFGEHIDEIFDEELNTNVFRFHLHTTPDNDRCTSFDRQRNEIKSYAKSPANLLGVEGEKVNYKWKFKLNAGFQASSRFTHLHQLKSVGGPFSSHPMYTLTARKGSPDELELRYGRTDSSVRLVRSELAPFIGTWLEVSETIQYGPDGSYEMEIKKVSDGTALLSYSNDSITNWRENADFVRPKWGIYRSIEFVEDLRDEEVLFADFIITEIY